MRGEYRNAFDEFGIKGTGESGRAALLPALVNAVVNELNVKHLDMPPTPSKVWATIQHLHNVARIRTAARP